MRYLAICVLAVGYIGGIASAEPRLFASAPTRIQIEFEPQPVPWVENTPEARPVSATVHEPSFEQAEAVPAQETHVPFSWSFPTEFALTHLRETGHYLQWAFALPYQLASLSYRQLCEGITWFGGNSCIKDGFEKPSMNPAPTGITASNPQNGTPRPVNWSVTPQYLFANDPYAGSTDLRLHFAKPDGFDIIFRLNGLQDDEYPEWRRPNEIQPLPPGRMIGLHFQIHF